MASTRTRGLSCAGVVLAIVLGHAGGALAQSEKLEYDLRIDLPLTLVATGWLIGSELGKSALAASRCRWCDRNADGSDALNGLDAQFRSTFRWNNPRTAAAMSSIGGYGVVPIATFGLLALAEAHDDQLRHFPVDALLIVEATAVALSTTHIVKFVSGRERPRVHARATAGSNGSGDDNTSFYSGHTSLAFSLAVSAATIATLRGYRWAPWVWVTGLLLASAVGYLRIAGDRHYMTDIFAAASTGAGIGFLLPFLHRSASTSTVRVTGIPSGSGLAVSWLQ